MQSLRIQGVVRLADGLRRELSRPITACRKEQLRQSVTDALLQIDAILTRHAATIHALPAPTRRAYEFLVGLDLDAVTPAPSATENGTAPGSIRFSRLRSDWQRQLDRLGTASDASVNESVYSWICKVRDHIENQLQNLGCGPKQLTTETREVRGWLAFFAQRANFEAYLSAIERGRPILENAVRAMAKFTVPAILHFRPTSGLYHVRRFGKGTRAILPTPAMGWADDLFVELARHLTNGGSRQRLLEATSREDYQAIQAELEVLGGVEEHVEGLHHDLVHSFDRVNRDYFRGAMPRPRLSWSRTFTGRKFGHYDPIRDAVMISSTLDRADVPEFVVDSVMHHELVHKELGVEWRNGRMAVHTPEFRKLERRFKEFDEAEARLKQLTGGSVTGFP